MNSDFAFAIEVVLTFGSRDAWTNNFKALESSFCKVNNLNYEWNQKWAKLKSPQKLLSTAIVMLATFIIT